MNSEFVPWYFLAARCVWKSHKIADDLFCIAKWWQQDFRIIGEPARVHCNIYNALLKALWSLEESWEKHLWDKHEFSWEQRATGFARKLEQSLICSEQGQPWVQPRLLRAWSSQILECIKTEGCNGQELLPWFCGGKFFCISSTNCLFRLLPLPAITLLCTPGKGLPLSPHRQGGSCWVTSKPPILQPGGVPVPQPFLQNPPKCCPSWHLYCDFDQSPVLPWGWGGGGGMQWSRFNLTSAECQGSLEHLPPLLFLPFPAPHLFFQISLHLD